MARPREGHEVLFVEAPIGLKERLRAVAKRNRRSVNGEAVFALERHVEAEEATGAATDEGGQAEAGKPKGKWKKGGGK